jgi:signal peptidase complex subunit 2
MAKPKQQKQSASASASAVLPAVPVVVAEQQQQQQDDEADETTMELLQVDVGDMVKLKQILDETVASTILGQLKEDYRWDNVKLAIMTAACAFAMVAQFAPISFPESRPLLGVCCCLYFLFSGILQFITTFVDQDCILLTKPLDPSSTTATTTTTTTKNNKKNATLLMTNCGVRVRSNLPRFSEYYTVILEFQNVKNSPHVEQKWSVGQFFDVEGMFDEVGLMQAVEELYKRLEAGNYETTTTTASDNADKKKKN